MSAVTTVITLLTATLLGGCAGGLPVISNNSCQKIESDIPWGALSGLSQDPHDRQRLYAIHDHNIQPPEILVMDTSHGQARITHSIPILKDTLPPPYDLEGITHRPKGGFWLVSEGKGKRYPDLLVRTDDQGRVQQEIPLPLAMRKYRRKAGLEGVASTGQGSREQVVVVFQRSWKDDPRGLVKIGRYWPQKQHWEFFHYPLEQKKNGLSGITHLDDNHWAVLERDNKPMHKAGTKAIYGLKLPEHPPRQADPAKYPQLEKHLLSDLLESHNILCGTSGKLEGLTASDGKFYLVTDDDGKASALMFEVLPR